MRETIKAWFIVILIFVILCLLGYIVYLLYRKKHTRERFAFFAVLTLASLAVPIITSILSNTSVLGLIIHSINHFFDLKLLATEPSFSDQALAILIFSIFAYFLSNLHRNWNSEVVSERHYKNTLKGVNSSLINDFFIQLRDFIKNEGLITPYDGTKFQPQNEILSGYKNKVQPWYENVAEIFTLLSNQYKINIEQDWYREESCLIATYGKERERIHIYCLEKEPTEEQIVDFVRAVRNSNVKVKRIIIAVEQQEAEKKQISKEAIDIEIRYKNELLKSLVDFNSYKKYIIDSFSKEHISVSSILSLAEIYVPSSGFHENNNVKINNVERFLINWADEKSNKQIALLGNYGQGKSVLALKLAYELIISKSERIPILIVLRGKSPRNLNPLEIIATWASNFRIDPQAILKLHYEGKLLMIFEGFDEMDLIGDAEMRMNHFRSLWDFAKIQNSKILITGRPNFFLDDKELREALGIFKPISISSPHSEAIYLNNFDQFQIEKALRNAPPDTRKGILTLIDINRRDEKFYELVSRPSTLFLVSSIWSESDFIERKEKINSAIVIREFILENYERQGKKRNVTPLTEIERQYFMMGIAVGMMRINGYSNQIDKDKLSILTLALLDNFPSEISSTKSAFEMERKPLKERLVGNDEIMRDSILTDVRSSGILVKDLSRSNYFKFAHKSFLEFLVSDYFVAALANEKTTEKKFAKAISKSANKNFVSVRKSKEVESFISELIPDEILKNGFDKNDFPKLVFQLLFNVKIIPSWLLTFFLFHVKKLLFAFIGLILIVTVVPALINQYNYNKSLSAKERLVILINDEFNSLDSLHRIKLKFFKDSLYTIRSDSAYRIKIIQILDSTNTNLKEISARYDSLKLDILKVNDENEKFISFLYTDLKESLTESLILEEKLERVIQRKDSIPSYLDTVKVIIESLKDLEKQESLKIVLNYEPTDFKRVWLIIFVILLVAYVSWMLIRRMIEKINSEDININDKIKIWYLACKELGYQKKHLQRYVYVKFLNQFDLIMEQVPNSELKEK